MKHRILIVEDSPTQALLAQALLDGAGYEVETAENGQVGLQKALADPPDLVIADIQMPVMDGYEMTRRLKRDPRTKRVPVLMLTAKEQPLDVVHGLEAGADQFVTKPYQKEELLRRIASLFEERKTAEAGTSPKRRELECFDEAIVITRDREQILQSMLKAMARVVNCEAMSLYLCHGEGARPLFVISFSPLPAETLEWLRSNVTGVLGQITAETPVPQPTETVQIPVEPDQEPSPQDGARRIHSFLHAPLIVEGKVGGLVSIFSPRPEAFGMEQARFLFDMGQKAATALSRVTR